jgi:peptidoglycan-N-acetylglucosamine deacetylase
MVNGTIRFHLEHDKCYSYLLTNPKDKGKQTNLVEVPVSWELDDAPHFLFTFAPVYFSGMAAPSKVYEIWTTEFEGAYESGGAFILTMHPQIIGRYHRLKMVNKLIDDIAGHPDVWFATCSEVVDAWLKHQQKYREQHTV